MRKSVLEEIYYAIPQHERYFIRKFLDNDLDDYDEKLRLIELEGLMNNQKAKYGNWWSDGRHQIRAYRQFKCNSLIVTFNQYKRDILILLGRPISDIELLDGSIKEEVEKKYANWVIESKDI